MHLKKLVNRFQDYVQSRKLRDSILQPKSEKPHMLRFITQRPLWVNFVAGLMLALCLLFLLILSLNWITHHGKSRTVPSIVGKSFDEAQRILNEMGFEVVIQDSVYQDNVPHFAVIRQVPEGDAVVKINRTVYLTINRAIPPIVEMPNLIGYSFRNAQLVLKNMNLRVGDTSFKPDFAKNSVLEQWHNGEKIAPGKRLQMGSYIDLVLGDGVGKFEYVVPSIVGMSFGEAKAMLASNGISIGAIVAPGIEDTMSAFIIKQNPERFNDEGKRLHIRPGQMMDVWLSTTRPVIDSSEIKNDLNF